MCPGLSNARIHLVTSLEEAAPEEFVVVGDLAVYYAQVFQKFQITCRVENMSVSSVRRAEEAEQAMAASTVADGDDIFEDPAWQSVQVVKECSLYYSLSWSEAAGCFPSIVTLDAPGCVATLSHEDLCMISKVVATLQASMQGQGGDQGNGSSGAEGGASGGGAGGVSGKRPVPRLLELQAEIGSVACDFVAAGHSQPWTRVGVQCVIVEGKRMLDGCYAIQGSLGSIEVTDSSSSETRHPQILTGSSEVERMVAFELATFDPASPSFPGYQVSLNVSVTRPKITLLWRYVTALSGYIASFRTTNAAAQPAAQAQLNGAAHDAAPFRASTGNPGNNASSALPFEMPADFSPFEFLEPPANGSSEAKACREQRQSAGGGAAGPGRGLGQAERTSEGVGGVCISIVLQHPIVMIPRNSRVQEAFVADLGKIEVRRRRRARRRR